MIRVDPPSHSMRTAAEPAKRGVAAIPLPMQGYRI
jgi:hypothetical protein